MSKNELIALLSAMGACLAAFFAWLSFTQSKRQADAVLGDVPPSFGAYQKENEEFSLLAKINLEIINHNRRALLIKKIWLEYKSQVQVRKDHDNTADIVNDLLNRASTGDASYKFEIPLRIKGYSHNSKSNELIIPFIASWKNANSRESFDLYFGLEYILEGLSEINSSTASVRVVAPNP